MRTPKNLTIESLTCLHSIYIKVGSILHITELDNLTDFSNKMRELSRFTASISPSIMCDCVALILGFTPVTNPEKFFDTTALLHEFIL